MGSGNELVDYSRAPCLGADQKARGLWERDLRSRFLVPGLTKISAASGDNSKSGVGGGVICKKR